MKLSRKIRFIKMRNLTLFSLLASILACFLLDETKTLYLSITAAGTCIVLKILRSKIKNLMKKKAKESGFSFRDYHSGRWAMYRSPIQTMIAKDYAIIAAISIILLVPVHLYFPWKPWIDIPFLAVIIVALIIATHEFKLFVTSSYLIYR